jgi:succinoglycan biosynthesis transport protein ExoP
MEQNDSFIPQVDLKVYGRIALRWAWLVILCAILAGGVAFLYSMNQTRIYSASSKVLVNEARNPATANYNDILLSERLARTYANLMQRDSTIEDTLTRLGLDPAAVRRQVVSVAVAPVRDTQLVQVTVESPNPELAAAMANTLPQVFAEGMRAVQLARFTESRNSLSTQLDELRKRIEANQLQMSDLQNQRTAQAELELASLRSEQTQLQASYGNLLNSFEQLRLTEAQSIDNIVLMEPADTPRSPVRPRTRSSMRCWLPSSVRCWRWASCS